MENVLVGCCHNRAMQLYQKNKVDAAIALAQKTLQAHLRTKAAPGLAVFMLNALYYQYLAAPDGKEEEKQAKADLLAKVTKTAKSILTHQGMGQPRKRPTPRGSCCSAWPWPPTTWPRPTGS